MATVYKLRIDNNLPNPDMSLHLVFSGNPGTGKTMIARFMARVYHSLGLLSKGTLTEVDRSGLVAGYIGQTAIKTSKVIESAMGGVLFIDEAYTLTSKTENDFGYEAVDTILKAMEDQPCRPCGNSRGIYRPHGKVHRLQPRSALEIQQIHRLRRLHCG